MRSMPRAWRALPLLAGLVCGAVALPQVMRAADAPAGAGLAALAARTPTAVGWGSPAVEAGARFDYPLACAGTLAASCFELGGPTRFVNVGTFFDRRRTSSPTHFFLKYFEAPGQARCRLEGFTFVPNRNGTVFRSAGAVLTSRAAPTFPSPDQLGQLQRPLVTSAGAGMATCVDLGGEMIDVEATQAVWLVLQFPEQPDSNFVGVAAETSAVDNPCDFLTPDTGELWYRPDPRQTPLDWMFVVHYAILPSRPTATLMTQWNAVKRLYR